MEAIQEAGMEVDSRPHVLGIPVCVATMDETVAAVEALILSDGHHLVATADASGIVIAQENQELRDIYHSASWVTADSNGVVWALGRQGIKTERVSGVDLADRLLALSAAKGYSVFFLGSAPGVAQAAKENVILKHPGCNIVGTHDGQFPESDFEFIAREIAPYKPDILLVAMGIPRQEKFIQATKEIIGCKVAMGVGGTLDVMSGRVKRAPVLIQKMKIEWLWRTLANPKKFSKFLTLPKFYRMVRTEKR
jgi:N-acetylglucosaminyldiphosphoundecaprenol N-acetyl-beta-D-mannosaminyltransferase